MRKQFDPNSYCLGSEDTPASVVFYLLVIQDSGSWFVVRKKDWDQAHKTPDFSEIPPERVVDYTVDGVQLSELVNQKLAGLGRLSN